MAEDKYTIAEQLYQLGLAYLEDKSSDLQIAIEPADVFENLIALLGELHAQAVAGKLPPIRMPLVGGNPARARAIIQSMEQGRVNITVNQVAAQDPDAFLKALRKRPR